MREQGRNEKISKIVRGGLVLQFLGYGMVLCMMQLFLAPAGEWNA